MTFWAEALPYATQVHKATGVLTSVLLAQTADETDYGKSKDWTVNHNPANVSPNGEASYPTLQAGTDAWINTMNNGDYKAVKSAVGWQAQCYALGKSPWAGGHYEADGGPPGEDLIKIITANNLTQYDAPSPPTPTPPAPQPTKEQLMNAVVNAQGQTVVVAANPENHLLVFTLLASGWSVDDVTAALAIQYPNDPPFLVQP